MSTAGEIRVRGDADDGWGKVADAFRANFDGDPGEVGAACCVYAGGRPVVDLWGGLADREASRSWNEETVVWSGPRRRARPRSALTFWRSAASSTWTPP